MTNTRITDPEILERRYPILLREFSIRGGIRWGWAGIAAATGWWREVEFLEPLNMAILSERRVFAPYGLEGGPVGQTRREYLHPSERSPAEPGSQKTKSWPDPAIGSASSHPVGVGSAKRTTNRGWGDPLVAPKRPAGCPKPASSTRYSLSISGFPVGPKNFSPHMKNRPAQRGPLTTENGSQSTTGIHYQKIMLPIR